jgi:hypothetical protein
LKCHLCWRDITEFLARQASPVSLSGKIIGAEEAKLFPVPIAEGAGPMPGEPTGKRAEGFLKILQFFYIQYLLFF